MYYNIEMVEPDKYRNKSETFQHRLTGRDQEEIYKTYTILPHKNRNEVPKPCKTPDLLMHALGIIIF